jgi:uncharacterized circularly permuted ATP-grasp superfamily protein
VRAHVPWTRLLREEKTDRYGEAIDLVPWIRANRSALVIKPNDEYGGSGVTLGREADDASWDAAIQHALADPQAWIVQERIAVRRQGFLPMGARSGDQTQDMLVDLAPYLFRGRMAGFLTRLSSTGLANVTSGGGQVPAFVVRERQGHG